MLVVLAYTIYLLLRFVWCGEESCVKENLCAEYELDEIACEFSVCIKINSSSIECKIYI